jgi:hypothetical protein
MSRLSTRAVAASLALATAGLALVAAPTSAVAAPARAVRFDPALHPTSVRNGYNQNGYNWSGYAAQGSGFTSVSAGWTEPSVRCNSSNDLFAPWVGIDGYGSQSVEQTGVATDCSSGSAVYAGWYEMYPDEPVYYSNPVSAGDKFTAKVTRSGTQYTLTLKDVTKGWSQVTKKTYNGSNASAEIIMESPTAGYPNFGTVKFTAAKINGAPLSAAHPVALDATNGSITEDHTSAISASGTAFSIKYLHE